MKRMLTLSLAALTLVLTLAGCTNNKPQESEAPAMTAEERTAAYKAAIEGARDDEMNQYVPVITASDEAMADMILPMVGVTDENATSYAVAVSAMNVQAYGIAAIMPAEGKSDEVLEGVKAFVDQQKSNFEMYLADQYDIANAAKVETLDDGTILLVMSEGQDEILQSLKDALK